MKILLVNKFYYLKGGAEKYLLSLEKMLLAQGHEVRIIAANSPANLPHADSAFFIGHDNLDALPLLKKILEVPKIFYRSEIKTKLDQLTRWWQPDLVHLNNINYQIGTGIIDYFFKKQIPQVMTLHDYQLISPNYNLYSPNHDCWQAALEKKFGACFRHRCYQSSWVKSAVAALESYYNHARKVYQKIDALIAPSYYLAQKFTQFGFDPAKIKHLPNFLPAEKEGLSQIAKENFYLYAGRLAPEKGINELIDFFNSHPNWNLKIAGSGDLRGPLNKNIELLGQLDTADLKMTISRAKAVIIPSLWPENCPYIALEAMALGTPVIAKNVGGLKELIKHKHNGFLFTNYQELLGILKQLDFNSKLKLNLSANSLKDSREYSSDKYYEKLMVIYAQAISNSVLKNYY